jgi:hypothetical protein
MTSIQMTRSPREARFSECPHEIQRRSTGGLSPHFLAKGLEHHSPAGDLALEQAEGAADRALSRPDGFLVGL